MNFLIVFQMIVSFVVAIMVYCGDDTDISQFYGRVFRESFESIANESLLKVCWVF